MCERAGHRSCATPRADFASARRTGRRRRLSGTPYINDHAPKVWWDGGKTLFHLVFEHDAQNIVRTSTDNGATWSKARALPVSGEFGNNLLRTREGVLAISLDGASLVISRDQGQTWTPTGQRRGKTELRPGGSGPCIAGIHAPLVQLADGRLMALGRCDDVADQERFGFKMPVSYSIDLGETWHYAASEFPVVSNTQRPVLLRLKEGPIVLCSFTDQARELKKSAAKGMTFKSTEGDFTGVGLFAAVSYDEGQTLEVSPDALALVRLAEIEVAIPLWRGRALDRLKQATELLPTCTQAWLALANYWSLRGQPDKQRRCLERILTYDRGNPDVRHALSLLDRQR